MPSVNDGFSYSDFTNKQDFTNKINGKGQPNGYVLTTTGTKSYWAPGGGGGSGLQGIQGIQGSNGTGFQGIQGISGGGGGGYYYSCRYANLISYNTPIEINSLHDNACNDEYIDEIELSKDGVNHVNLRDVTLTPVTTTCPNGNMVVDERSPFAFGTCFTETYANSGTLNKVDLSECPIAALYWKPNSTSRSYTYFKDGETGGGTSGTGSYVSHGAIRDINNGYGAFSGYVFVLGIDLGWASKDRTWNFSRAMQSDHYLLFDNQDGLGGDAVDFICPKIFIKNAIQNPVECPGFPYGSGENNYIMDPYKNVKFMAMENDFTIQKQSMMLFHLSIRRFPYLSPKNIDEDKYLNHYTECGGVPKQTNDPKYICDTLFVSLDWTIYKAKNLRALSDSKAKDYEEGYFVINNSFYNIE